MKGNLHVRFGGRRLETQVKLCAGRLPYDVAVMLSKGDIICCSADSILPAHASRATMRYEAARTK